MGVLKVKKTGSDGLMRLLLNSGSIIRYTIINLKGYSGYTNHHGRKYAGSQDYQQSRNTTMINTVIEPWIQ